MGVIDNIIQDKQDIKNQLGSTPNVFPTVKKFNNHFEVVRHSTKLQQVGYDENSNILVWNHPTYGFWGNFNWGNQSTAFVESFVYIFPNNNQFYERWINNFYISSTSTGTLDSDLETYTLDNGEIMNSEYIAKFPNNIVSVRLYPNSQIITGVDIEITNDDITWIPITSGETVMFDDIYVGNTLRYRITNNTGSQVVLSEYILFYIN